MRALLSRSIAALVSIGLATSALAAPPLIGNIIGKQAFHGPGSRGFHAGCSAPFGITNSGIHSNNFSSWTVATSAGTTPAAVTSGAPDPTGGTGAYQVVYSIVTGATKFAVIDLTTSSIGGSPVTLMVMEKIVSGNSNGTIYSTMSLGTNFTRTAFPNDNNWHMLKTSLLPTQFTNLQNPAPQIGINLNDVGQSASTGTITIDLWVAAIVQTPFVKYITPAMILGPLATTTAAVTATVTLPCPTGIAFRNFSETLTAAVGGLAPATSNPVISENATELYQAGGISDPYASSVMYSQGFYWGFANSTSNTDHAFWMSFSLYKSRHGLGWTEDTTNAPYLQTFGSAIAVAAIFAGGTGYDTGTPASGTMTWTGAGCAINPVLNVSTSGAGAITSATRASGVCTTWPQSIFTTWTPGGGLAAGSGAKFTFSDTKGSGVASFWQLHPAWLPYGCTISSTFHPFCTLYGAEALTGGTFATFMGWSDTINGVYTPVGCTGPGVCSAPTPVISAVPAVNVPVGSQTFNANLPSVVNVGGPTGTNYIFTAALAGGNTFLNVWSTPAIPTGTPLAFVGTSLFPATSVDWDTGSTALDPVIVRNKCGFYEMFYTAFKSAGFSGGSKQQVIGYAISDSPAGPFFRYSAPIVPVSSSMYFSTNFIGDSAPLVINGRLIWLGNFDNGTTTSRAVAAVMQDACSY
jgi:hypothetical protein